MAIYLSPCTMHLLTGLQTFIFHWYCFVLMYNVPVNSFSAMSGRSHRFLSIPSTFGEKSVLLNDTTRRRWVSNHGPLAPESDALPLSHRTPWYSFVTVKVKMNVCSLSIYDGPNLARHAIYEIKVQLYVSPISVMQN